MARRPRSLRLVRLALGKSSIALIVFGVVASTALACTSAAPTSLSTTLSGGGKEGAEITVSEGSGVKDQASLSGKNAEKATGSIEYLVYSDKECKTLATKAGKFEFTGGKVPASEEKTLEAGAVYYWQAVYSGDSLDEGSTSPCGKEVLTVKAKTSLSTILTSGGEEGDEIAILAASEAEDKATLSGTNSATAGGKAVYDVYSDEKCEDLVTAAGEVTVSSGSIPASSKEELEDGIYYWQATYQGDSLHQESKSPCGEDILTVVSCSFPYCESSITPGVSLTIPLNSGNFGCTAGPILTKGTEIFLLTAGHCLLENVEKAEEKEFKKQKVESAYPKAAGTKKSIGENGEIKYSKKYDLAEVKVENQEWLLPTGSVPPVIVEWLEPTPAIPSVAGEAANKVGETTCHTGVVSKLQCGTILRIGEMPELELAEKLLTRENLVETTAKSEVGDSGGPEFAPGEGTVSMQGTVVSGGKFTDEGEANLTNGSPSITEFPEGSIACKDVKKMKELWAVPVKATKGIPAGATVTKCEETGATATIEMSVAATETVKNRTITFGHSTLSWYEPMSQIKAAFPGQALLVK